MRNEQGFALVLTLIVTALLVALAAEFVGDMYVATVSHRTYVSGQQAGLMAESGAIGALRLLKNGLASSTSTSLLDPWAKPIKLDDERGTLEIAISEESARLNLNTVVSPNGTLGEGSVIFQRLLKKLKLAPELSDTLTDWIDTDEDPRPGGAESAWYRAQLPPYAVRNAPLATLEELALVKGFDPASRQALMPFVTVYCDAAAATQPPPISINVNTAPVELLALLDDAMTDDLARRIDEQRKIKPFASRGDLANVPGMATIVQSWSATKIIFKGSVFRIVARATVGDTVRVLETVARVNNGAYSILYWREY